MSRGFWKDKQRYGIIQIVSLLSILFLMSWSAYGQEAGWQDFEYWDSPQNHGWVTSNYPYPFYGYGIGYGSLSTIIDFAKGSRVLEVRSQPSVFNNFERFTISNSDSSLKEISEPILSFDIAGIFGIEYFDQFEFQVWLITNEDRQVVLRYLPIGEAYGFKGTNNLSTYSQVESQPSELTSGGDSMAGISSKYSYSVILLGRQYQDGGWHKVIRNMDQDIDLADDGERNNSDGFGQGSACLKQIRLIGNIYRLDNISFESDMNTYINHPPKLQRIGPMFTQIFNPFVFPIRAGDIDYPDDEPCLHSVSQNYGEPFLFFEAYIGGRGARGSSASNLLTRVKIDPNTASYTPCSLNDPDVLPDVVQLVYTPQVFEDLIISICVYDERGLSDMEVFSLIVVNYPIPNYPPQLEELENDVYVLGSDHPYYKQLIAYDFEDKSPITFFAYIDDQPYYGFGPYQEDLIKNPLKGLIEFTPIFEGVHKITVVARDTKGLMAFEDYTLIVANPSGWYNHPPILGEDIDSPQYARAGRLFSIPVEFFDPDLEQIYYSCNIGSITHLPEEGRETHTDNDEGWGEEADSLYGMYRSGAIYSFFTYFPGIYNVEIIAYDRYGANAGTSFVLDVQPSWSYSYGLVE